jgi:hypothetical protein
MTKLAERATRQHFEVWIVGDTPLIVHAWSEKARREMLQKQVKAVKGGKDARNPEEDFRNSLYEMGDGTYGFPAMGVKKALLDSAHKDKGIARTVLESALYLHGDMVRTRPALVNAVCDMPLLRIYGSPPQMREDMVRIGKGLQKTANLAYRAQFTTWALKLRGRLTVSLVPTAALAFLVDEAGFAKGIGEWRNEKSGMFGAFHAANAAETKAWEAFASGKGKLPLPALAEAA